MLEVAIQCSWYFRVVVCSDVFKELISSLCEINVIVIANEPSKVRIFSTALVISDFVEKNQQVTYHFSLSNFQSYYLAALKMVVEPHLHLAFLINTDLIFINAEETNNG